MVPCDHRWTGSQPCTRETMPVLVIGDAVVDQFLPSGLRRVGGCGLNVAVLLRMLGNTVELATSYGNDAAGAEIAAELQTHGILAQRPSHPPPTRVASVLPGPRYAFSPTARPRPLTPDWSLYDGVVISGSMLTVDLDTIQASGSPIYGYDPNPRVQDITSLRECRIQLEAIAAHSNLVKLSDDDCMLLYSEPAIQVASRLRDGGRPNVLISKGIAGAELLTASARITRPAAALPGPLVDTVGAGDALLAGMVAGHLEGDNPIHTLDRALRLAALVCTVPGALPATKHVRQAWNR